jgi:hypothetical protein
MVALAFQPIWLGPKRWAADTVFCSNATVTKCKELRSGPAMRSPTLNPATSLIPSVTDDSPKRHNQRHFQTPVFDVVWHLNANLAVLNGSL